MTLTAPKARQSMANKPDEGAGLEVAREKPDRQAGAEGGGEDAGQELAVNVRAVGPGEGRELQDVGVVAAVASARPALPRRPFSPYWRSRAAAPAFRLILRDAAEPGGAHIAAALYASDCSLLLQRWRPDQVNLARQRAEAPLARPVMPELSASRERVHIR